MITVMGLDLSLASTGVCVMRGAGTETHTLETKGKEKPSYPERRDRIAKILGMVAQSIPFDVDLVVLEAPSYGSNTPGTWDRGGLWWGVVLGIEGFGHPLALVPPKNRAKFATGDGNARKPTVMASAMSTYRNAVIRDDNQADAVILAAMGMHWLGQPRAAVPPKNVTALDGCVWPPRDRVLSRTA